MLTISIYSCIRQDDFRWHRCQFDHKELSIAVTAAFLAEQGGGGCGVALPVLLPASHCKLKNVYFLKSLWRPNIIMAKVREGPASFFHMLECKV